MNANFEAFKRRLNREIHDPGFLPELLLDVGDGAGNSLLIYFIDDTYCLVQDGTIVEEFDTDDEVVEYVKSLWIE